MDVDIILTVGAVVVSFIVGKAYGEFLQAQRLVQNLSKDPDHFIELLTRLKSEVERLKQMEKLDIPLDAIELKLEWVNNMYYCYRADTEEFMGQNIDKDHLLKSVSDKLKGAKIWAKDITQSNQTA